MIGVSNIDLSSLKKLIIVLSVSGFIDLYLMLAFLHSPAYRYKNELTNFPHWRRPALPRRVRNPFRPWPCRPRWCRGWRPCHELRTYGRPSVQSFRWTRQSQLRVPRTGDVGVKLILFLCR
jgi:hypothetical protein